MQDSAFPEAHLCGVDSHTGGTLLHKIYSPLVRLAPLIDTKARTQGVLTTWTYWLVLVSTCS